MGQTKLGSLTESLLNITSGFFVSLLIWIYIVTPLWDIEMSMLDNLGITGIFTISAVIRSYIWRRIFNYHLCKTDIKKAP